MEYTEGLVMRLKQLQKGTIWGNRKGELVYIDQVSTELLRSKHPRNYVDYYDEFGLKVARKDEFLSQFRYIGKARLTREELASKRNLVEGA